MATTELSNKNNDPDLKTICRLCLEPESGSVDIFLSQLSIPVRIMACAALEVQQGDGLPNSICEKCRYQLEVSYLFRKKCQLSDGKLRKHIRLLNAGRKSRVFLKPKDDDDDGDEDDLQFEESIKFIEAKDQIKKSEQNKKNQKWLEEQKEMLRREETLLKNERNQKWLDEQNEKNQKWLEKQRDIFRREETQLQNKMNRKWLEEQNEKNEKWLQEQREIFRREETELLFEDLGNFMQARRSITAKNPLKKRVVETIIGEEDPNSPKKQRKLEEARQEVDSSSVKPIFIEKQEHTLEEQLTEVDVENEINSSEQISGELEKQQNLESIIYSDDGGDCEHSEQQMIKTFLIFDEHRNDEENQGQDMDDQMQCDDEDDALEEIFHEEDSDREDLPEENDGENKTNEPEDIEEYMFTENFNDSNHDDDESEPNSVIESYQNSEVFVQNGVQFLVQVVEEIGDSQYLKDERQDVLSMTDDEIDSIQQENSKTKYVIENDIPIKSEKLGRKVPVKLEKSPKKNQRKSKMVTTPNFKVFINNGILSSDDLKIFKCSECPQSFTRAHSLMRHRSAHKSGREYSCDRCDKCFSCKSSLDRHIRIHTGEKPFTCDYCGKNFMQKEILKRHVSIHTGKRPHQCPFCPKAFVQKLLMNQHINATHLENPLIEKHLCHLCPKSFIHPSGLSRHLTTHKGQLFTCTDCNRGFNDKSSLRRHTQAVHLKQSSNDESNELSNSKLFN